MWGSSEHDFPLLLEDSLALDVYCHDDYDFPFIANAPSDIAALLRHIDALDAECDRSALFHKPLEDLSKAEILEIFRVYEMVEIKQLLTTRIKTLETALREAVVLYATSPFEAKEVCLRALESE